MKQSEILQNGGQFMFNWRGPATERINLWNHWADLNSRPDWDGFVTIEEGIAWAKDHPNSCDYCKFMYAQENLGGNFSLVNEERNKVYILYCTSETCCNSGIFDPLKFYAMKQKFILFIFSADKILSIVVFYQF